MGIAKRVEKIASEQKSAKERMAKIERRMAKIEEQGRLAVTIRRAVRYLLRIIWQYFDL